MSEVISKAIEYITELYKDNADGHDLNHSMRVYKTASEIAGVYPDADAMVIGLSSLLHDVDDHKLFDTVDNENAKCFLESQAVPAEKIEEICDVINAVSFSKNKGISPKTIEGCIVQDADRLDAMGAIGIARTFAYGGKNGRSIEASMDHFYEKLLLLKDQMNTPEAMKIAEERHQVLEDYIAELKREMDK